MAKAVNFTSPVGRLVWGSLYAPRTTDAEGKPLVIKSGPDIGKPRADFAFGIAIAKGTEQHWNQTQWGALIWQTGQAAFPQGQANSPAFAWKVIDGDSQVPNRKGRKPCDREGYPRHWIVSYSSSYAPRIYNANGTAPITEVDAVKPGYYIQVAGNVAGNDSPNQPGVYLNHSMVAFSGYGEEIVTGPDPASAGFGQAPLPAGLSATPIGALAAAPPPVPVTQGYVAPAPTAAVVAPAPTAAAIAMPPAPPHYPILGAGAPPSAPLPAPVPQVAPTIPSPPAPPARQMLPAANGVPYEAYIANGWTDDMLRQNGMMV